MNANDRTIRVGLTERQYQALTDVKDRYGLTWSALLVNADWSHLEDAGSVAAQVEEVEA